MTTDSIRLRDRVRWPFMPLLRAYVRNLPGSRRFWSLVGKHFEHTRMPFVTATDFGATMSGDTCDVIDRFVYFLGVWEPNLTNFLMRSVRPGDTFVDVGANVGYYTLLASPLVGPTGKVVAIEASPSIFEMLTAHIAGNGLTNVRALNVAASDVPSTLTVYRGPRRNRGSTSVVKAGEAEAAVPARPLSAILQDGEIETVRVVKIDVEGAELMVVRGMEQILSEGRADLLVMLEVAPESIGTEGVAEVLDTFRRYGFHPYEIANSYNLISNLPPRRVSSPTRLRRAIDRQTDIIFSRADQEIL